MLPDSEKFCMFALADFFITIKGRNQKNRFEPTRAAWNGIILFALWVIRSLQRVGSFFLSKILFMQTQKNEAGNLLPITVMEGVTVNVLPNSEHEFLIPTKDVAIGYGVSVYAIRQTKLRNNSELIEGKHFISNVTIRHAASAGSSKGVFWTKRGIIRLGFFIKSERAKLFRDTIEDLVIKVEEQRDLFGNPVAAPVKQLPAKRLINRLDRDRLIRLLALTSRIADTDLRISIANELTGGLSYGNH